ncbi:MAG: SGNH/GDSL hydrolase family protein [Clostridia bacterium]|nr:SGNH/GDSL hydrolase family protein [Clostridia bacterium]
MKKIFSVILALCLLASLCVPVFAESSRGTLITLGDSIAEGYGIMNSDEAGYGRIVADTDGYAYENFARTATDSAELLDRLQNWREWSYYRNVFARATVICLSIGSNDYFDNDDVYKLAVGAFFGVNGKKLDAIADAYYENLCAIIDILHEMSPDATILLQKVYCVWYGISAHIFKACQTRVNDVIDRYDAAHPGAAVVCDISPAMDRKPENLADDCVHPNAAGNVAIARVVLQKLCELGLGTETEPVVNVPGEDYNFYVEYMENKTLAKFLTVLIKILTGNVKNLGR